jgi:hypothetical protein
VITAATEQKFTRFLASGPCATLLRDVLAGRRPAEIDLEIGAPRACAEYRRRHPGRRYAIARRPLNRAER